MNARVFPRRTKFTPPKSDEYVQKLLEFRDRKIRTGERIMKTKHTPGPLAMGTDCDSKDLVITNENKAGIILELWDGLAVDDE